MGLAAITANELQSAADVTLSAVMDVRAEELADSHCSPPWTKPITSRANVTPMPIPTSP
jgi:hypothetical protein